MLLSQHTRRRDVISELLPAVAERYVFGMKRVAVFGNTGAGKSTLAKRLSLVVDAEGGAARGLMFGGDFMKGGLSFGCQLSAIMEELQLETPCTGSLNATFMRALRRRRLLGTIGDVDTTFAGAASKSLAKFRHKQLKHGVAGSVGRAIEAMFQALAPELSEGLAFDEDFAGLIDHALGDWLVQPTVYDMLDYELPEDIECRLDRAFARFREIHPEAQGYAWFPAAFKGCGGTRMREVLTRRAPRQDWGRNRQPEPKRKRLPT